ncbi:hypothetical protein BDV95DRAFT_491920 [Massariosphaeria phaeospora]|uniref:Uncharacterized protein n=1 Tax=Massariosphaeria phaeospora TaxID=100035 RepID=A0A7C8M9C9_9PLEO|nr:hypothetical protein BDV95DRAFT_491920 [Massariosphaeria phaeospora]
MPDYPGLGLPLRDSRDNNSSATELYPIGAHNSCRGATCEPLPVRELAMMHIMECFTDREDWHEAIFDDQVVAKWREEVLAIPDRKLWDIAIRGKLQWHTEDGGVMIQEAFGDKSIKPLKGIVSEMVFSHCVEELRSKARYYVQSGVIPTLDAYVSVAKSDALVTPELHAQLRNAFETLHADQVSTIWRPRFTGEVQDIVNPSMYPLVYGRSKVLKTEAVGVQAAVDKWAGKGGVIEKTEWGPEHHVNVFGYLLTDEIPLSYWSDTYQWLPANVAFQDDGSVKFTSYVNNLHPTKYPAIYRAIEKLIEAALPMWDQCLALEVEGDAREGAGRMHSRFATTMPEDKDDQNADLWIPSDPRDTAGVHVDWEALRQEGRFRFNPNYHDETAVKWRVLREPKLPEPAFEHIEYAPDQKRLVDRFRERGLQVIVKMESLELAPEPNNLPVEGWQVDGQMNEHICATALYRLDGASENVSSNCISFRAQTPHDLQDSAGFQVGRHNYHWMERIYGTKLSGSSPCLQNYGSVDWRGGRLLAFPNVFQHLVSRPALLDRSKPGRCRYIALYLVDPTRRILSTANVPPQQRDWWLDALLGLTPERRKATVSKLPVEIVSLLDGMRKASSDAEKAALYSEERQAKLPLELMELVRAYFEDDREAVLMGEEEAEDHRGKLAGERGRFEEGMAKFGREESYSFPD